MTESEAKAILERDLNCLKQNKALPDSIEAMQIAINALEKQIHQKISKEGYCGFVDYICPVCGNDIDLNKKYNYCSNCGQRLEK